MREQIEINISRDLDGSFNIRNEVEPIFCFSYKTREAAIERILSILRAYEGDRDTALMDGDVTRAVAEQMRRSWLDD